MRIFAQLKRNSYFALAFLFEHDLFGKPASTFPDHAIGTCIKTWLDGTRRTSTMAMTSFMDMALDEARCAGQRGEVPVGCVLVRAHRLGSERLDGCDVYVTLEPCAMCAAALSFARIRRLYYGASDPKGGAVENGVKFFAAPSCHHRPEIYGGFAEGAAGDLLKEFFRQRR
jgi:tRNA(adenine34) deaminase